MGENCGTEKIISKEQTWYMPNHMDNFLCNRLARINFQIINLRTICNMETVKGCLE